MRRFFLAAALAVALAFCAPTAAFACGNGPLARLGQAIQQRVEARQAARSYAAPARSTCQQQAATVSAPTYYAPAPAPVPQPATIHFTPFGTASVSEVAVWRPAATPSNIVPVAACDGPTCRTR
jgi:putative hemolysin